MVAKKRPPRPPRPKKKPDVELPPEIPVKLVPDPPKPSRIESLRKGLWRLLLFIAGLSPMAVFAFQVIVLRQDKHLDTANVILILGGVATSIIVANISDDKISKSAKEITPIVRGVLRAKSNGTTSENKIVVEQDK